MESRATDFMHEPRRKVGGFEKLGIVGGRARAVNGISKCSCVKLRFRLARSSGSCEDLSVKTLSALLSLMFCLAAYAADCPKNQPKTKEALLEAEQRWADALSRRDADTVGCILAAEFQEVDVDGSLLTRADNLTKIPNRKPGVNHLSEMTSGLGTGMGYTRGLAELVDAEGKIKARVRFTDVFVYRDGRWQAILGQETLLGAASR